MAFSDNFQKLDKVFTSTVWPAPRDKPPFETGKTCTLVSALRQLLVQCVLGARRRVRVATPVRRRLDTAKERKTCVSWRVVSVHIALNLWAHPNRLPALNSTHGKELQVL